MPDFLRLNPDWNAEPNAPHPRVQVSGSTLVLRFLLNPWAYPADEGKVGCLKFTGCSRWHWDATNDHAWYAGTGRYAGSAPEWGEYYEIVGEDPEREGSGDWNRIACEPDDRHFLFYLRDETFECFARSWSFRRESRGRPDVSA
jgi:hypothetical protein